MLFLTVQAIYVVHATPRNRGRAPHNTAAFGEIISQNQENDKGEISSDTAAFHRHSKPNLTLFGFTQHLLKAIKEGKDKFTGLLESGRHDHDLAMEFAFDLSNKLVSFVDLVTFLFFVPFPLRPQSPFIAVHRKSIKLTSFHFSIWFLRTSVAFLCFFLPFHSLWSGFP